MSQELKCTIYKAAVQASCFKVVKLGLQGTYFRTRYLSDGMLKEDLWHIA